MLIDQVCDFLLAAAGTHSVADVRLGLGYTAVRLDDGRCGLAYTFRNELHEGCGVISAAGTLVGRQASDLAQWARSTELLASAVGLATLNELIEVPPGAMNADLLTQLEVRSNDVVGMVGYFEPFIGPLRTRGKALHVFERRPAGVSGVLPESAAAEILPQCQVAILTATTLLNRTLDGLLALCQNAREVAIVGPSTPLPPGVFSDRGVTLLSGIQVVDGERALRLVSEGGGTLFQSVLPAAVTSASYDNDNRQLGNAVRKLTVHCR
jgi:uncharacterized protein (DUF4213/DUF364 family)